MADSYRPDYGDPGPRSSGTNSAMYHFQGNTQKSSRDRQRPPSDFSFRAPRPKIAERPLLKLRRDPSPDLILPGASDAPVKFREVAEMTDSEAEDMELSDEEPEGDRSKRVKLDTEEKVVPQWSNPDPYTVLPPVEENARKRTDVVKLIRKARVANSATENNAEMDTSEDFISFNFGDLDFPSNGNAQAPADAPTGPSLGKRKRGLDDDGAPGTLKNVRGVAFHANAAILNQWRSTGNPSPWYKETGSGLKQPLMSLHTEIVDFYDWVKPRDFEHTVRSELITRIEKALGRFEPGSEVRAFGSFAAGLYLPTGDMDLVLLSRDFLYCQRTGRPYLGGKKSSSYCHKVARALERQGIPARPCHVIGKARVPIVKFVDKVSGIKVDLSFDNDTGLIANETFQQWKLQYPAMPIIVSVIKQFLMIRGLNDNAAGGLGGFATICIVTSLIQLLPQDGSPPNLGQLLVEFFNLYGNLFNRYDLGIRMDPPGYFEKRSYKPFVFNQNKTERLSIIDPNKPDNDISGGSHHIDIVFKAFSDAYERLKDALETIASQGNLDGSILAEIVGGNYEYYDQQRVHLKAVYDNTHPATLQSQSLPPPPPGLPPPPQVRPAPPPLPSINPASLPQRPPTPISTGHSEQSNNQPRQLQTKASKISNGNELGKASGGSAEPTKQISQQKKATGSPKTSEVPASLEAVESTTSTKKRNELRADKLRKLRPDIEHVPRAVTMQEALKLGGYKSAPEMTSDLDKRAALVAAANSTPVEHLSTDDSNKVKPNTNLPTPVGQTTNGQPKPSAQAAQEVVKLGLALEATTPGGRRAERLRKLRPDIPNLPSILTTAQVVQLGGYKTHDEMTEDLQKREAAVLSTRVGKMASSTNFPELVELRNALWNLPGMINSSEESDQMDLENTAIDSESVPTADKQLPDQGTATNKTVEKKEKKRRRKKN